jgi:aspartate aminotransferase-like enzyme
LDLQLAVNLIVGVAVPIIGWFGLRIQEMGKDLNDFKVTVAREYATNHDLAKIDAKLDRILERMDSKQDRA